MRRLAGLVLRRLENRDEEDERFLSSLMARHSDLAQGVSFARDFAEIVRNRTSELLDSWLQTVLHTQLKPLVNFGLGLLEDYDAVKAGITLEWSNGHVESRIKCRVSQNKCRDRIRFKDQT